MIPYRIGCFGHPLFGAFRLHTAQAGAVQVETFAASCVIPHD